MLIAALDADAFRLDKATQMTVGFLAQWSQSVRTCAATYNKKNFFIPGEITGGDSYGSIYIGRGRQPDQRPSTFSIGYNLTGNETEYYLRDTGLNALDASAFQYSVYRSLTRWLGLDGALSVPYDIPVDFVDGWHTMVLNEDLVNPNTGEFDPRHMNGMTNHDVFRWPAIPNGTQMLNLGTMIAELVMPGLPLMYYGEEQDFYMLDSTADNYLFGRQSMGSSMAWLIHGCWAGNSTQYERQSFTNAQSGCTDFFNAQDHRDVSAPARNVIIRFHEIRNHYPVVNDGFCLTNLGNWTDQYQLPNSVGDNPTNVGLWSVHKQACADQVFTTGAKNQDLWYVYSNRNTSYVYTNDCTTSAGLFAPSGTTFTSGQQVQNLLYPNEIITLSAGVNASVGCIPSLSMDAYDFKAFVPVSAYSAARPVITKLDPMHDARILSTDTGSGQDVQMTVEFSQAMDCDGMAKVITINSTTLAGVNATLGNYTCGTASTPKSILVGAPASVWQFSAQLENVYEGIHKISLGNASTTAGNGSTTGYDSWLFRVGKADNPMVFPLTSNYTSTALSKNSAGVLSIEANAAGADMFRYSLDWGSTYSTWTTYSAGAKILQETAKWTGTKLQQWDGDHAILQYWSKSAGSSAHVQHADYGAGKHTAKSFPHLFIMGPFNEWGYDAGARNQLKLGDDGKWRINFVSEAYPSNLQLNVWGINPDGSPDATWVYGTLINDTVIERTAPSTLSSNIFNISTQPDAPYLGWQLVVDDANRRISFEAKGSYAISIIIYLLCLLVPLLTAVMAVVIFKGSFYSVKFNQDGRNVLAKTFIPLLPFKKKQRDLDEKEFMTDPTIATPTLGGAAFGAPLDAPRKTVLIATLEYNIEDWGVKIKIGGLGVMAQLMAQNLKHQDLIWVVPCVGDVTYPEAEYEPPMEVKILDQIYQINVMIHKLNNITYVLLDAPVFRRQSTVEPYPARMDDLESAIFYSAWNQCIAETSRRFPVDLYHINDYHGALAPLYRLPDLMPCALSLHNAEFQGLWPLRTPEERDEVCAVYNISPRLCQKYVQFGNVFNLLHAAVSFLRIHQKGFGAVGVSTKYGKRSWARYPIFWGLKKIGNLPNPDPTDTGDIGAPTVRNGKVLPNETFEANRKSLKRDAQEWAGLKVDPTADLLVFVGRWSMQKGIDLIADIVPTLVEEFNVQIITVGPIIDLYGKFAAEKLARLMEKYPERVYSRPEFTALPPYIFSGADFTMIPSRDEPFGLVAVEFGRKGALGIGARVGGLGQMPGWWYTVESSATSHLLSQFESACRQALASNDKTRAVLRAKSALQRFPVQEWIQKLDTLQAGCIRMCKKKTSGRDKQRGSVYSIFPPESSASVTNLGTHSNNSQVNLPSGFTNMPNASNPVITLSDESHAPENFSGAFAAPDGNQSVDPYARQNGSNLRRQLSLGSRRGPGHRDAMNSNAARDINGELIAIDEEDPYETSEPDGELINPDQVRGAFRGYGGFGTPSEDGYESEDNFDPQRSTMYEVMDDDSVRDGVHGRGNFYGHSNASSSMSLSQMANTPYGHQNGFSSPPQTPPMSPGMSASQRNLIPRFGNDSRLSLASVMTGSNGKDFSLSKVKERFTDEDGMCLRAFSSELRDLNPKNSKGELCIEEYLIRSEKSFFTEIKNEMLGVKTKLKKGEFSSRRGSLESSRASSFSGDTRPTRDLGSPESQYMQQPMFMAPKPKGIALIMQRGYGEWPLYTISLAIGQILAATSYQLTLLSSTTSQSAAQLYTIGIIFMFATVFWWTMYRLLPSVWALSAPFAFYSVAFFLIGLPGFSALHGARNWINAFGTWFYAVGSASGSLYFALNFGDEGGSSTQVWIVRACLVQGTQQIWGSALWYWGEKLSSDSTDATLAGATQQTSPVVTGIVFFLSVFMALSTYLVAVGLPDFYRQLPGRIPAFYMSLVRRKLVIWFMVATFLQNYWLATLYGRSWRYLWSSTYINDAVIFALVVLFFIVIWGAILLVLSVLSKTHSWVIPVFGIGLGAPRWTQTLWATSNIGAALPWAGSAGPYLGRCLWLWLGVLDAIQGVGIGMVLLQTLTRAHVATTLMAGQMVGAAAMLIGRATSPSAVGPANTFLDFATWSPTIDGAAIFASAAFWICLFCQVIICVGYIVFFRKEQLSKP